MNNISPFSYYT